MSARSDDDDADDGFLGRWIRRKAEAREHGPIDERASEAPNPEEIVAGEAKPEEPAFDLSSLPGLDEITAQTNLSDFMRKEVPAALRNAALKKAWALDPTIRDYVNPAREYAYDWNTPGGVPGNGPLEAGFDALKQVAQALGMPSETHTLELRENTEGPETSSETAGGEQQESPSPVRMSQLSDPVQTSDKTIENESFSGARSAAEPKAPVPVVTRRRHGGAAPV